MRTETSQRQLTGQARLQEMQLMYSLVGNIVQWTLLKATLALLPVDNDSNGVHARATEWCRDNLNQALEKALNRDGRMDWHGAADSLISEIIGYNQFIGDIEQTAAGEKSETDDLLLRSVKEQDLNTSADFVNSLTTDMTNDDSQSNEVRTWLTEWLQSHLNLESESILHDSRFSALGLDSIQAAELMMDLDDRFGVELDMSAAWEYPTIHSLAQVVTEQLDENSKVA